MRQLHVLGVSDDGETLLLGPSAGKPSHRLPLDDKLRAAVRGQLNPRRSDRAESALSPKEMQARMREGATPEDVAKAAGVPVARVLPYAAPVIAERERIVDQARAAVLHRSRGPNGQRPLGDVVDAHLADTAGFKPESVEWTARRRRDGAWEVHLAYAARGGRRTAGWLWRPLERDLTALDVSATRLAAEEGTGSKRRTPKRAASAAKTRTAPARKKSTATRAAGSKSGASKSPASARPAAKKAAAKKATTTKAASRTTAAKATRSTSAKTTKAAAAKTTRAATSAKAASAKAAATKAAKTASAKATRPAATKSTAATRPAATKAAAATRRTKAAAAPKAARPMAAPVTPVTPAAEAPTRGGRRTAAAKAAITKVARRKEAVRRSVAAEAPVRPVLVPEPEPELTPAAPVVAAVATHQEPAPKPVRKPAARKRTAKERPTPVFSGPTVVPDPVLETGEPPSVVVIRPQAESPSVQPAPAPEEAAPAAAAAKRKAGQRVPIPSWSDVLLGVAPAHRNRGDDDDEHATTTAGHRQSG